MDKKQINALPWKPVPLKSKTQQGLNELGGYYYGLLEEVEDVQVETTQDQSGGKMISFKVIYAELL